MAPMGKATKKQQPKPTKKSKLRAFQMAMATLDKAGIEFSPRPESLVLVGYEEGLGDWQLWPAAGTWKLAMEKGHKDTGIGGFMNRLQRHRAERRQDARIWAEARPRVTIFTDASLCATTGFAGWGAWMKADGERSMLVGSAFREKISSSTEAEIRGGANAIAFGLGRGIIKPGDVIMWQCDSTTALQWLMRLYPFVRDRPAPGGLSVPPPRVARAKGPASTGAQLMAETCQGADLKVIVRHVRGHQAGELRQWVNRKCDEIAKTHMRRIRAEHERQQGEAAHG